MSVSQVLEFSVIDPSAAAQHFQSKLALETDPSDVYADQESGNDEFVLMDVRSAEAYATAHVRNAISLPHRTITPESMASFLENTLIVVYCWGPACNAACKAGLKLVNLGFKVKEMIGGFEYWVKEGLPTEGAPGPVTDLYGKIV